jgi:ubiquinone/menaquinone biosynthesis C-methylase UbiE
MQMFGSGMVGWAKLTDKFALVQGKCLHRDRLLLCIEVNIHRSDFPWRDLPSGTTFCDIGGGIGSVSMPLAKAHLHLQLTLQDQSSVLDQARAVSDVPSPSRYI